MTNTDSLKPDPMAGDKTCLHCKPDGITGTPIFGCSCVCHTPRAEDELNKILTDLWCAVDIEDVTERLIDVSAIDDAVQAINAYTTNKIIEARIDEVKKAIEVVYIHGSDDNVAGIINTLATRRDDLALNHRKDKDD